MQQDAERQAVMRKKEEERQKEARDRRVAEAQERRQIQQQAAAPATTSNKPGAPAAPAPEPKRQVRHLCLSTNCCVTVVHWKFALLPSAVTNSGSAVRCRILGVMVDAAV